MNEALERIRQEALARLQEVREEKELEELNSSVLGRSGSLTGILRTMGQLDKEQRAKLGQASNAVKKELEQAIAERRAKIAQLMQQKAFEKETLDVTEPGIRRQPSGIAPPLPRATRRSIPAWPGRWVAWASPRSTVPKLNTMILTSQS